ncbi:MAG: radical SAM protein [Candidatus Peribacteria bacterium]|jgi:uncharacterized protein|nr:radical SAM protein [Candidatus Peribacteria bacterium]
MQKSKFLQKVGDENKAFYYHSLFGNLFLLNREYISVLESSNPLSYKEKDTILQDLIDNKYLVDESVDERKILQQNRQEFLTNLQNGKGVISLDLNISELCNFVCPHCMNGCQIGNTKNKLMTWKVAKMAIGEYVKIIKQNGISGEIHFGSAEPLLNWELIEKVVLYCQNIIPDTQISINTNLSLLTKERALFFKKHHVFIATSLDGPKQGNDLIRIQRKGGTYDAIIQKMKLLQEIEYPLDGCSLTMNDLNMDFINEDFILFLKSMGFRGLATDIDLVNNKNCSRDVNFYVDKLISLYKLCKKIGIENFGSWTAILHNLVNQEEELITYCKAQSGRNLSVNPIGDIFLCGYSTSRVGNVNKFKQLFSYESEYYKLISLRLPGTQKKCYGCQLEGICSGQCLVSSEFSSKTNNRVDFLCDFYRKITAQLLELRLAEEV